MNRCTHILQRGIRAGEMCGMTVPTNINHQPFCRRHYLQNSSDEQGAQDEPDGPDVEDTDLSTDEMTALMRTMHPVVEINFNQLDDQDLLSFINELSSVLGYNSILNIQKVYKDNDNLISFIKTNINKDTEMEGFWGAWIANNFYYSDKDEECIICLEKIVGGKCSGVKTGCDHIFHTKCLNIWFDTNKSNKCPLCRGDISSIKFQKSPINDLERLINDKGVEWVKSNINNINTINTINSD